MMAMICDFCGEVTRRPSYHCACSLEGGHEELRERREQEESDRADREIDDMMTGVYE